MVADVTPDACVSNTASEPASGVAGFPNASNRRTFIATSIPAALVRVVGCSMKEDVADGSAAEMVIVIGVCTTGFASPVLLSTRVARRVYVVALRNLLP